MSTTQKRDILWNMIDPGDPYDIRKSLIARLPGDNKIYMGDHLELVVLFQGAEIERLIDSLSEYKLKYKELEKVELDRHSYEVQIKELSEMCQNIDPLKSEIMRLKDFVSRQTNELEEYRRREAIEEDIHRKYDQALEKIQTLFSENNSFKGELNVTKTKFTALERAKNREIEELKFGDNQRKLNQDQEIREIKSKFQSEITQLENEIDRYKERLENQRANVESLKLNEHRTALELDQYRNRMTQSVRLESQMSETTRRIDIMNGELERTQNIYNEKSRENIQLKSQLQSKDLVISRLNADIKSLEAKISRQQEQISRLRNNSSPSKRSEYGNVQTRVEQYEQKLALLTQQVQRLNLIIQTKREQLQESERRYIQLEDDYEYMRGQASNPNTLSPPKPDRPGKGDVQSKQQLRQLRALNNTLSKQNDRLKVREEAIVQEYELQIKQWKEEFERLKLLQRSFHIKEDDLSASKNLGAEMKRKLTEGQNKNATLNRQVQNLNSSLRGKEEENNRLIAEINRLNIENSQLEQSNRAFLEIPASTPNSNFDSSRNDRNLRVQNQQIRNKLARLSSEVERLNDVLKTKLTENIQLTKQSRMIRTQMAEYQSQIQESNRYVQDANRRITNLERSKKHDITDPRIQRLTSENQRLQQLIQVKNRQLQHLHSIQAIPHVPSLPSIPSTPLIPPLQRPSSSVSNEYQVASLKSQVTRLNDLVRRRQAQVNRLEGDLRQAQSNMNRFRGDSSHATNQTQKTVQQYQSAISDLKSQTQNTIRQYENTIMDLKSRLEQMMNQNQRVVGSANHQQTNLVSTLKSFQDKTVQLSTELERLSGMIRQKDLEITNLNRLNNDLKENANRIGGQQVQQSQVLQNNLRNQMAESTRVVNTLRDQIQASKRQGLNLQNKLREYDLHGGSMQQQLERLNRVLAQKVQQINNYEKSYRQIIDYKQQLQGKVQQQHTIIVDYKNKFTHLPSELERVNAVMRQKVEENEILKDNVNDYSQKYNELLKQYQNVVNTANSQFQLREQDIQSKMGQYEQMVSQLKRELDEAQKREHGMGQEFREGDMKRETMSRQIDRLNNVLKGKVDELQMMANENSNLKNQFQQQRNEADRHIRELSGQLQRVNQALSRKLEDEKINYLSEIERLNNALRLKVQQSTEWQHHIQVQQRNLQQISQAYEALQRTYNQLLPEYQSSRGRMADFQLKFKRLTDEFQKLSDIIRDLKQQNQAFGQENYNLKVQIGKFQNLQQMNRRLQGEIDRLSKEKQILDQDIAELRIRYSDEAALQKRLNQQLSLFVVLFAEIESLRKRVRDKEKEVEEVRRSSLAPFRV